MGWNPISKLGVVVFNFAGSGGDRHLALEVGDLIVIREEYDEWYRGHHYHQPSKWGIFPACLVEIKDHTSLKIGDQDYLIPVEDEVVVEASHLLKEWKARLRLFYLRGESAKYQVLLGQMEYVLSSRRHLMKSNATHDIVQSMKTKLTAKLDQVNDSLELPVSPRDDNGRLVNCYVTGVQKLYRVHTDRRKELDGRVAQTGALNRKQEGVASPLHLHHLFLHINKVDHEPPEDCEVFFFLYDSEESRQVSERFMMHVAGVPVKGKKPTQFPQDKTTALFTDLGSKDLDTSGMYLVCQLIRKGKMLLDDKKNVAQNPYRRPYAGGVLDVSAILRANEERDKIVHEEDLSSAIYNMPLYLASHENDFSTLHTFVIKKNAGKPGQKLGCAISMVLKAFHGDLNEVKKSYPSVFESPLETVHKMGFPDVILPGDVRNDIYVTLEGGTFEKGAKRSERNVEVAIEVIDGARQVIPRAILLGAGGMPFSEYESFIYYHNNTPKWTETMKLSIPFEKLPDAHLRVCFRHVAKAEAKDKAEKTFAFSFLKLMKEDGSIVCDGQHELYVYKSDHKRCMDPRSYLSYASCKEDVLSNRSSQTFSAKMTVDTGQVMGGTSLTRSFKESITISTLTCSTKLTQKIELLMLLKWRQRERDLSVVLTNMQHISGEEVVKFLQDTLDCLFDILSTNQEVFGEKIFEVLVTIFNLMSDDKYQHFTTVLDIYISNHFSAALAHKFLIWCFSKHVQEYGRVPKLHHKLVKVFKSMPYLFKFMIQSSILYKNTNKMEDVEFKEELRHVFSTMGQLLGYQENKISDIYLVQSVLLQNLPAVLPEVASVLPIDTVAELVARLLDSVRNTHATIPGDKLVFMVCVLNGPVKLFHSAAGRSLLVQTYVGHLISYLDHTMAKLDFKPEVKSNRDCMDCLGRLLETLADPELGTTDEDIERLVSLILSLLRLSKVITRNNPLYRRNMVCFLGLLDLMKDIHFATFFDSLKSTYGSPLKDFIMDFMMALTNLIKFPLFNSMWVTLYLMQARVITKCLSNVSRALLDSFLAAHTFNPLIWDEFFSLCTIVVMEPYLQIEKFSNYRKSVFLQQFGDLRLTVGKLVIVMWHKLKELKGQFIPDLINSFLKLSLLKPRDLRKASLPLIFDVVRCEHRVNGNFKRVETEVFDKMDALLFSGQGDVEYMEMFSHTLTSLCNDTESLKASGIPFVDTVTRLIALLLDYRNVPADDTNKGRRMGCMLNLLRFYKDIEKEELYVKYIYKLAELHEKDQNYTEAGFTLLLHAKGLEWDSDETLSAVDRFPSQGAPERKQQLYQRAIDLFDQGKAWECGIPLCKELAGMYEKEFFDYTKLAASLQREADFFRKIIDIQQLRVAPEYFMVGYYGKGFPLFLSNKIFVHRGQPYEKLSAFIKRLTDEYTATEVLKTTTPPESDIQNSKGMYLQVRAVQPIAKDREEFKGRNVPNKIAEYYLTNEVQEFRYDRPFHKGKKNKECEFASLWVDRTTFTTVQSFPGVISWFEVSDIKVVELDPLGIALETLESKNQEIELQVAMYSANKTLSIHPLSMLLNGVIDAAVQGGVKNYDLIFFNPAYTQEHPGDEERVKRLRSLIEEQTVILEKALHLHGQRIDHQLQGLQTKLEQCFEDFQAIVFPDKRKPKNGGRKVARAATIARPLPPTPIDNHSSSVSQHSTLPHKMRRATGFSAGQRIVSSYEDTEIGGKPLNIPKGGGKSSSPSPIHGTTLSRKQREGSPQMPSPQMPSPQMPSPYLSKKHLSVSPSTGDLAEQQHGRPLSGSHNTSSSSSLNQISDNELDNYEPVSDFLPMLERRPSQSGRGGGSEDKRNQRTSLSSFQAPSYPAPVPPKGISGGNDKQKSKNLSTIQSVHQSGDGRDDDDDDDDDDDGYEPVVVEGGQVSIKSYDDEVERAQLPLLSSSSTPRSSLAGDSSHSSPMRNNEVKSPAKGSSVPEIFSPNKLSSSPRDKTSLNEGAARYLANVKAGRTTVMPPEPTTPPPSPPIMPKERDGGPPSMSTPKHSAEDAEQPKLPPKKRSKAAVAQPVQAPPADDDDVYAFDRLDPSPTPPKLTSQSLPPKPVQPSTTASKEVSYDDSNVYEFDTLEKVTLPARPPKAYNYSLAKPSPVPSVEETDEDNVYEFDRLEKPPALPKKMFSSAGPKIKSSQSFNIRSSYDSNSSSAMRKFGSMVSKEAPPSIIPKKPDPPINYQFHDDPDVYEFDNLEPQTPKQLPPTPTSSSASMASGKMHKYDDTEIYSYDMLDAPVQPKEVGGGRGVVTGDQARDNLSPETGQVRKHIPAESYSLVPPARPPPKMSEQGGGASGGQRSQGPLLPPKSSPPIIHKPPPEPSSSPEAVAPPIPLKKRPSIKTAISVDTGESNNTVELRPRPTPRPRTSESLSALPADSSPSLPPRPPHPSLPPKPSHPAIPPKSKPNGDTSKLPIPSKVAGRQWPPKR